MTIQWIVQWCQWTLNELNCQISSKSNKYKFSDACLSTLPLRISKDNNYYNNFWAFFQDLLLFLLGKPIAAVILCLFMIKKSTFHDKDVNKDENFKLIFHSTFSTACMKTVGLSEFLIHRNCRKFWHCHRKETDYVFWLKHLYHFKVRS